VAGEYVKREDFRADMDRIFDKLDIIDKKLDSARLTNDCRACRVQCRLRCGKEFVANGKDLSDCFGFIGQMTTAKEDLKLRQAKKKALRVTLKSLLHLSK
jgi:hypothetical protein